MKTTARSRTSAGYSFAEVLIASALLGAAIGGAVSMSANMNLQNQAARTAADALNLQDCAARLWQLGLSTTECDAILPQVQNNRSLEDAVVPTGSNSVVWSTQTNVTLSSIMGTVEQIDNTVTVRNPAGSTNRPNVIKVYRPTIR